ncbi:BTAD domain-containing putative transcriptional regulator [Streptomyces cacaoi]|nr:BTAD domain-containing putative transcriptional regulator [Streptomyces cacaoi]
MLGPLELDRDGVSVPLPRGAQRTLLATLALRPGRPVPVGVLAERLWDDRPPASAQVTVRNHVKRLRRLLDPSGRAPAVHFENGGYRLDLDADALDLHRFRARTAQAEATADPDEEARLLREALALWRGPALTDVTSDALHREVVPALAEEYAQAQHRRISLDMRRGAHAEVITELRRLVGEDPLRERFWALLIRALHRTGRQAEALACYEECRRAVADALGVDPSAELRELHRRLLADGAAPPHPPARTSAPPAHTRTPAPPYATAPRDTAPRDTAPPHTAPPHTAPDRQARSNHRAQQPRQLQQPPQVQRARAIQQPRQNQQAGQAQQVQPVHQGRRERQEHGEHRQRAVHAVPAARAAHPAPALRSAQSAQSVPSVRRAATASAQPPGGPPASPVTRPADTLVRPGQLPPDVPHFTGQDRLLAALDEGFAPARGRPAAPAVALVGEAGVGKTALAVHWAHRMRGSFPDGQLYIDLGGHGPHAPLTPGDALAILLAGVYPGSLPEGTAARTALWRSVLADRRMLVVLDNAHDSGQVRPLLPGGDHTVVVTSRNQLRSLVARDGAHRVQVGRLTAGAAAALFGALVGHRRCAAEPEAVAGFVSSAARLPLLLRGAAERVNRHPGALLAELSGTALDGHGRQDGHDAYDGYRNHDAYDGHEAHDADDGHRADESHGSCAGHDGHDGHDGRDSRPAMSRRADGQGTSAAQDDPDEGHGRRADGHTGCQVPGGGGGLGPDPTGGGSATGGPHATSGPARAPAGGMPTDTVQGAARSQSAPAGVPPLVARSYRAVPAEARRLHRLLAARPGRGIDARAAAAAAGLPVPEAARLLDRLAEVHLLLQRAPDAFELDALTAARSRLRTPPPRRAAVGRPPTGAATEGGPVAEHTAAGRTVAEHTAVRRTVAEHAVPGHPLLAAAPARTVPGGGIRPLPARDGTSPQRAVAMPHDGAGR